MKSPYHAGNSGDGKGLILSLLIVTSLILLGFSERASVEKPKSYGLSLLAFFQGASQSTISFFTDSFNSIGELKALKENYEKTQKLLENYAGVERELESLRAENRLLKEQLDFSSEVEYRNVSAKIIGKEPENFFSSFVINKGTRDGLKRDMAVVAYDNGLYGLVGKVEETGVNSSIVIPITNSQCFVAARLQKSRNEGLVNGLQGNGNSLVMKYVNKKAYGMISQGELVLTSGMKSLYPQGVFIGRVETMAFEDYDTSMELTLTPIIDISRIEYVFVLTEDVHD